mmetsp:Transcript_5489/g.8807  ORF Transcript_5489/g.8807 Transcript_5489/m.8807 type:complete len:201 (+) Transcript_5489:1254-1856(+)
MTHGINRRLAGRKQLEQRIPDPYGHRKCALVFRKLSRQLTLKSGPKLRVFGNQRSISILTAQSQPWQRGDHRFATVVPIKHRLIFHKLGHANFHRQKIHASKCTPHFKKVYHFKRGHTFWHIQIRLRHVDFQNNILLRFRDQQFDRRHQRFEYRFSPEACGNVRATGKGKSGRNKRPPRHGFGHLNHHFWIVNLFRNGFP